MINEMTLAQEKRFREAEQVIIPLSMSREQKKFWEEFAKKEDATLQDWIILGVDYFIFYNYLKEEKTRRSKDHEKR